MLPYIVRWHHFHNCFVPLLIPDASQASQIQLHGAISNETQHRWYWTIGKWLETNFFVWNIFLPIVFHSWASYIREPLPIEFVSPPRFHTGIRSKHLEFALECTFALINQIPLKARFLWLSWDCFQPVWHRWQYRHLKLFLMVAQERCTDKHRVSECSTKVRWHSMKVWMALYRIDHDCWGGLRGSGCTCWLSGLLVLWDWHSWHVVAEVLPVNVAEKH